jgi:hypothetical protein
MNEIDCSLYIWKEYSIFCRDPFWNFSNMTIRYIEPLFVVMKDEYELSNFVL